MLLLELILRNFSIEPSAGGKKWTDDDCVMVAVLECRWAVGIAAVGLSRVGRAVAMSVTIVLTEGAWCMVRGSGLHGVVAFSSLV